MNFAISPLLCPGTSVPILAHFNPLRPGRCAQWNDERHGPEDSDVDIPVIRVRAYPVMRSRSRGALVVERRHIYVLRRRPEYVFLQMRCER